MEKIELIELSEDYGLEIIQTTIGNNGYPRELRYALSGRDFDSYSELREFATNHDMKVIEVIRKSGGDLWVRKGEMNKPYFESDFNDNIIRFGEIESEESFVQEKIANFKGTFYDLNKVVNLWSDIYQNYQVLEPDEIIVIDNNLDCERVVNESLYIQSDSFERMLVLI